MKITLCSAPRPLPGRRRELRKLLMMKVPEKTDQRNATVWIVIHILQLLVTAAVLAAAGWLIKKLRKAGRSRKEKKRGEEK